MSENLVLDLSMQFAIDIVNLCERLKGKNALVNQLLRSGTSVGANIHEANYASSKADFIAKLQIALKECSESEYWLELLIESGYYEDTAILEQCIEVKKRCHNPEGLPSHKISNSTLLTLFSITNLHYHLHYNTHLLKLILFCKIF